ncbi:hypothetical protein [Undibacterium flavidum]|uniref:Lipoprotein n=1 Tax=Undibacterium flavidum TaxID=2762297 RepID=A0ABR6YBV2_9BURK|nr:hypothetical protein [Undibacterium flavidum]MBC3874052.1 hypothetical protein [Undibacterium flavidum]
MVTIRTFLLILVVAVAGCGGDGSPAVPSANQCPLITVKSEQTQGGFSGCVVPSSSTQPVNVNGVNTEIGFWVRGYGPNGTQSSDLRFYIIVRHLYANGLVECSFDIDGTVLGEKTHVCQAPMGNVQISVTPQ